MREVAERAGVAMSSVSRVLAGHPDVSPAMTEKVMRAVEELDYQPDMLAQSLRRRETLSVGFVVGDISNPLIAEIVTGAESTLHTNGYSMLLTNSLGDPLLEAAHIALLSHRRVDGLVISVLDETHPEALGRLRELDIPVVVLDRNLPAEIPVSRVLSDHRSGMKAAGLHLLDLGHRRIGLIAGAAVRPSLERRAGLEEAFAARGLPATYTADEGVFSVEHGAAAMRRLLDLPEPPTAIIAGGNQLMLGALRVVSRARARARPGPVVRRLRRRRDHRSLPAGGRRRPSRQLRDGPDGGGASSRTAARRCAPFRCRPPHGVRRQAELRPAAAVSGMRAGVGRADITPPVGIPAGGWGNQLHEISEGNDLELWATVLVVEGDGAEAGGGRAAIVDVDLCIFDDAQAARARSIVAQAAGLPVESVAVGTTHNHSVPVTLELGGAWIRRNRELVVPYVESVFEAIGQAAAEASASMRPVRVGAATGRSPLAVNRRMTTPDGRAAVGLDPDGVSDPTLTVVRLDGGDDRPVATIVHYACHPDHPRAGQHVRDSRVPGHREARRRGRGRRALPLRPGSLRRHRAERAVRGRPRDLPQARRDDRPRGSRHGVPRRLARTPAAGARRRGIGLDRLVRVRAGCEPDGTVRVAHETVPLPLRDDLGDPEAWRADAERLRERGVRGARGGRAGRRGTRAHRAHEVRPHAGRARRRARRA